MIKLAKKDNETMFSNCENIIIIIFFIIFQFKLLYQKHKHGIYINRVYHEKSTNAAEYTLMV